MLNIVLFCGGSGGKALQRGFDSLFDYGNYRLDAIINAYDNGKSTGICRSVFNKDILGPSDLRKNQLTQFSLKYKKELEDKNSKEAKLLDLFELRFSADTYLDYYSRALELVNEADYLDEDTKQLFTSWIDHFFYEDKSLRKGIDSIEFKDFSLSNIFYASCASLNNNSLEKAGMVMSEVLGLEDRVHVISDVNVFLHARTESGYIIDDEGDLVVWNNPDDKVVEALLWTKDGKDYLPSVNEQNEKDMIDIVNNADIIIFSSGTQWSSLIPTYMHKGFRELINSCKAKKYLVMNNKEDYDCIGVDADELLKTLKRFIDLKDITVVLNDNAAESMSHIDGGYNYIHGELSEKNDSKHDPKAVVGLIMKDYYGLTRNDYQLVSDLDGTLWDELMEDKTMSIKDMALFKGVILSGNNYKHVYDVCKDYYKQYSGEYIYCNYGNTYFTLEKEDGGEILSDEFLINEDLINEIKSCPEYQGKVTVRGGAIMTIKPLTEREEKLKDIQKIVEKYGDDYKAEIAGHTSIDIMKKDFSKEKTFELIIKKENLDKDRIVYLGNELKKGNDEAILRTGVKTIETKDVFEAYMFLKIFFNN